jgi:cytochrome c556
MKNFRFIALLTIATVGVILVAQEDTDLQAVMKSNGATMGSLNKKLAAKDSAGASSDALKLEANLKLAENFFAKRGTSDASNFAAEGQMAAAAVAKSATAGDFGQAGAELKKVQAACGGCHMAHREGTPQTGFKIK